jgi:adenosylmethionine-8-amino-7-oxononanoate aminotransferase
MTRETLSAAELIALDQAYVWHPYAPFPNTSPVYPVSHADGVYLHLTDGRNLIDGTASWWSVIHGYNRPELNRAIEEQLRKMSHVMLGGLTHEPVARLAQQLVDITPDGLNKVFFSDSGSVAVEVAMKMALQFWFSQGQHQKTRFLALRAGYHGDTFAAMSVCDPFAGMHHLFTHTFSRQIFSEAPSCKFEEEWDERHIANFSQLIQRHRQNIAAVILEPIAQNAGGMRFYSPHYLRRVRELCDKNDVLLIADEIATGFGRTGKLFACEHAGISPDIMCLGKGLTGGYLTLAATLANDKVSDGISSGNTGAFMHGPTFMGNALACSVALASIQLLLASDWQAKVAHMEEFLKRELEPCRELAKVADVRVLGAIGVVELKEEIDIAAVQALFVKEGIWVRPFGKLVYLMPAYIITDSELKQLTRGVYAVLSSLSDEQTLASAKPL